MMVVVGRVDDCGNEVGSDSMTLSVYGDSDDVAGSDDEISLHDSQRPVYLHIATITTTPGEGAADHAQCFSRVRRSVRVRNITDRLYQRLRLVVFAQLDFDLGVIAEGDETDSVSAGVDVQVHREILHEVQDTPEVGISDTSRRVGEEHDVGLTRAV